MPDEIQKKRLDSSRAYYTDDLEAYQSGNAINRSMLDSNPSGNGDITSILRILPNIQYDNAQLKSTTPGEIDPANISISGGLYYQNNFQLDGFNMNNDLDPNGQRTDSAYTERGGRSQGLNIDTSLLESIQVLDSNISAAYGKFTGGVVEANIRKPKNDGAWHGNVSYQFTSDKLTTYHIREGGEKELYESYDENYQPKFTKHLFKSSVEGYITPNLGLIASFNTTQSFIPLRAYNDFASYGGTEIANGREQKRQSYNYYLKTHYNPNDSFTLETSIVYMPQYNTYYNAQQKDSYYEIKSGGLQLGIKALWDTSIGLWSNTFSYQRLENSRRSDKSYFLTWFVSDEKNWAYPETAVTTGFGRANEGGYGNVDQLQNTLNYKTDFSLTPISIWRTTHNMRLGGEFDYQDIARNRLDAYYGVGNPSALIPSVHGDCLEGADNLGLLACSSVRPSRGLSTVSSIFAQLGWDRYNEVDAGGNYVVQGQWFNSITTYIPRGKVKFDNLAYSAYIEDDIALDLGFVGNVNARVGLRFDGDSYMSKHTLAPRFSLNYITPVPKEWQSQVTFGLNRYYARNLFSYRLYDYLNQSLTQLTRATPQDDWVESANPYGMSYSTYKFTKLKIPYSDELMIGLTQNLANFSIGIKYIYRNGKDEIMQNTCAQLGLSNCRTDYSNANGYSGNATRFWTNNGKSQSHIISLIAQNHKPLDTFGIKHHYLLAFDYTQVKRGYNLYGVDSAYYDDEDILYNGQIIKYRDRPVDNYNRPYTLRLTTTHTFDIGKTRWLVNNLFRYRASYDRVVRLCSKGSYYRENGVRINCTNYAIYDKERFLSAFTWDMRVGFEMNVWKRHIMYINVDIYNVLNARNKTAISSATTSSSRGSITDGIATASGTYAVYELGRQFWLQVGYKF